MQLSLLLPHFSHFPFALFTLNFPPIYIYTQPVKLLPFLLDKSLNAYPTLGTNASPTPRMIAVSHALSAVDEA